MGAELSDSQADSIIMDADKIMRCLMDGGKNREALAIESGLGIEELGKAFHHLMKSHNPPWIEKSGERYILTREGRDNAPPPAMPEWASPDVDPRVMDEEKTTKKDTKNGKRKNGASILAHIQGLDGKKRVDAYGRPIFKGANGKVLDAIRNHPDMGVLDIIRITKMTKQVVLNACNDLELLRQITSEVVDKKTVYREVPYEKPKRMKEKIIEEKPQVTIPGTEIIVTDEPVKPQKPVVIEKEADELEEKVRLLLKEHDAMDVVLTVLASMDGERRAFKDIQKRIQSQT